MKKIYLTLLSFILLAYGAAFGQVTFKYTGAVQTYTVPAGVNQLSVDVRGAQGQANVKAVSLGGYGGRVQGTMTVTPCEILYIYVGGGGATSDTGGFNGGGKGG